MTFRAHSAVVFVAVLVVAVLAGCTPAATVTEPTSSPSSSASPAPTSAPTQTPAPTASASAAKPALADLVVSPDGIGPLHIGEPVPDVPRARAVAVWDATKCDRAGQASEVGDPAVGGWTANYPKVRVGTVTVRGFSVYTVGDVEGGDIHSLWVSSPKIATAESIALGSTLAELKAAYPDPDYVITSNRYVNLYVLDGTVGRMTIEVAKKNNTTLWSSNQIGTVRVIHLQPKTQAAFAASGDSDGLGLCSETPGFIG